MNKTNLLLDLGIFTGFMIVMEPNITGVSVHEWFALAFGATLITHLLLHWKWITGVLVRFFKNLWHVSRLKFVVDTLLFVAMTVVMMSGVMISRSIVSVLGIRLAVSPVWRFLHSFSADATLALVGLHFALSWNWVVGMLRRYLVDPLAARLPSRKASQTPAVVAVPLDVIKKS
jgi:hypothetical protein